MKKCKCNAYMTGECVCGAWDNTKINEKRNNLPHAVLNEICFPLTYLPVYRTEGEKPWVDCEQITTDINRYYKNTVKNCRIVGEIEYHPHRCATFLDVVDMQAKVI